MVIINSPICQLTRTQVPEFHEDTQFDHDFKNFQKKIHSIIKNHFEEMNHEVSVLERPQAHWVSEKLNMLLPLVPQKDQIQLALLIQQSNQTQQNNRGVSTRSQNAKNIEIQNIQNTVKQTIFEDGLDRWLQDPTVTGDKELAVSRIKEAYNDKTTTLNLSFLRLSSLPSEIGELTTLIDLDLHFNWLQFLPDSFGNLRNLTSLKLEVNTLQSLPNSFGNLKKLTSLRLEVNKLQSLPDSFGNLTELTELTLHSNKLQFLPDSFGNLKKLTSLRLEVNKLQSLPDSFGNLKKLTSLTLYKNKLQSLPDSFGNLKKLTFLRLFENILQSLPDSFGNLTKLTHLDLYENKLQSLPDSLGNLTELTELTLHSNELQSLPDSLGNLTNLYGLALYKNQLRSLPTSFGNLISLGILDISDNPNLQDLPMTLAGLSRLTELNTNNTQIPPNTTDAILSACHVRRYREINDLHGITSDDLPIRIGLWKSYAETFTEGGPKRIFDLNFSNSDLDESKKIQLSEWLIRLEKACEFQRAQGALANKVCKIIETVKTHTEFKEIFFNQIGANLESCGDRAAMSFNEIYTSWLLHTTTSETTNGEIKQKLNLLIALAKTFTLRKELTRLISNHGLNQNESAEIYLFYEINLKERLGLMTAIESMTHEFIGQRDWIQNQHLVRFVNENYHTELFELPLFNALFNNANYYTEPTKAITKKSNANKKRKIDETNESNELNEANESNELNEANEITENGDIQSTTISPHEKLEDLYKMLDKKQITEQEYRTRADALMHEAKQAEVARKLAWLQTQLNQGNTPSQSYSASSSSSAKKSKTRN